MLLNYLRIAFRTLLKFKGYAAVNLLGLSLGLTTGILILMYVTDELSFDTFHAKGDRIYRVTTHFYSGEQSGLGRNQTNGWPVGKVLQKDFPEVEEVLYARSSGLLINKDGKRIRERSFYVSPEFFDIFSFEMIKGNPATALNEPYTLVLTETMEKKYFPGEDGLNKTLILGDTIPFIVTGIVKDVPAQSHIQFDVLLSFNTYLSLNPGFNFDDGWGNINMHNYVLLKAGTDAAAFSQKARNIYMERAGEMLKDWGVSAYVNFEPLDKIYLDTESGNSMGPAGSRARVYLVSGVGVFVILLACINFINLTTARSVYRAREIGLRKVVGSTRFGLIRQFLTESFVLTLMALVIAVAFSGLLIPLFNELLAKSYSLATLVTGGMIAGIIALVLIVTFLSGYYPSVVMSAMRPSEVLKGKMQSSTGGVRLRRVLVVFQFVISVGLVMGTLIVIDQLDFMQRQALGFAKDEIFIINAGRAKSPNPKAFETFKNEIKALAITENVTFANSVPGTRGWNGQVAYPEGKTGDDAISVEYMAVDEDYLKTLGLTLLQGESFDLSHEAKLNDGLVLNETAVAQFGWSSPEEAIGKRITSPSGYPAGEVIGVVKNYHQTGLQQDIGPIVMDYNPASSSLYAVRYKAADTQQLIESLTTLWKKHFPGYDFNYFFLDQDFERQYQAEAKLAQVFGLFSTITITIAVIGLLGLVSFMVAARTKEIGVRKVLGASVFSITSLLSKEFIILVVISNCIAFPLTWYFSSQWLAGFAYRTSISPLLFALTLLIAVTVTLLTISVQTVRAALADPVDSLRYE